MKLRIALSSAALLALLCAQSQALPINILPPIPPPPPPPAAGDMDLDATSDVDGNLTGEAVDLSLKFPPNNIDRTVVSATAYAAGSAAIKPTPNISAAALGTAPVSSQAPSTADVLLVYFFEIVHGSALSIPVPVNVTLTVSGSVSSGSTGADFEGAYAYVQVTPYLTPNGPPPPLYSNYACNYSSACDGLPVQDSFATSADIPGLYSNMIYTVTLAVDVTSADEVESGGIDPTITLDPGQPGFALEFSPNLTPLPSTWSMMLIGLAGLGFVGYRQSRKAASPSVA
jgi:hypothetical protein